MKNSTFNNKNLYEIKYIDINDTSHEEKTAFLCGLSEEDIIEEFTGANLQYETSNVINEPTVLVKSVKFVGNRLLV